MKLRIKILAIGLFSILTFATSAFASTASNASTSIIKMSQNKTAIQFAGFDQLLQISGAQFFIKTYDDTASSTVPVAPIPAIRSRFIGNEKTKTQKKKGVEIIRPEQINIAPSTVKDNQPIWVINQDWTTAPAHQGNSFVTISN